MESFLKNFLEPFSYLIYAVALGLEFKRNKLTREKVLFIYYLFATLIMCYASIISLTYGYNNWLYDIHYSVSIIVFTYYFLNILDNSQNKITVKILFTLALLIFILTKIFSTTQYFNSIGTAFFFLSVLICSFLFFRELLSKINEKNILLSFDLWLVSGYILYFLGSFFIILSYDYFSGKFNYEEQLILGDLWSIQNCLLFIASIISLGSHTWITYQNKLR